MSVVPMTRPLVFDLPMGLPRPRGPVSAALLAELALPPTSRSCLGADLNWSGSVADAPTDDDLQLALFLAYELHYRGLAGVDPEWEWQPELISVRWDWEQAVLAGMVADVEIPTNPGARSALGTAEQLTALAASDTGPSASKFLMQSASREQFEEFLIHRSIYHLKEADPHSWAIPRLSGSVKAALITIQADEYGLGRLDSMHAQLFRRLMFDYGLDTRYGHYLDTVPGVTLLSSNLITLFGLHRRWRGALVGHLAMFEMTSSVPNARYARGHRRLGGSDLGARFFDEHVVADAVHEQIAAHELAAGLVAQEPRLAGDVIFGARCAQWADEQFAAYAVPRWQAGLTTLRSEPS